MSAYLDVNVEGPAPLRGHDVVMQLVRARLQQAGESAAAAAGRAGGFLAGRWRRGLGRGSVVRHRRKERKEAKRERELCYL